MQKKKKTTKPKKAPKTESEKEREMQEKKRNEEIMAPLVEIFKEPLSNKESKITHDPKKGGRPPKYTTESELSLAVVGYIFHTIKSHSMANKAGLCMMLGVSRDTYNEYKKRFPDTLKLVETYIENVWVQNLKGVASTGSIFYLKNAFKELYKDRQEVKADHTGSVIYLPPKPIKN